MLVSSSSSTSQTRAIVLLAVAGFAGQSMVRSADSLLPQIAADLAVTIGAASIVVSAYSLMHGTMQLVIGPIGDRFGKYPTIAVMCALSAGTVAACGLANSLTTLTLARISAGATASWIIPLGMAYIGDVVPYERRQAVLGRYLTGQISGQLFGQAAGGIIGDWLGWRAAFFIYASIFALAALALFRELAVNAATRPAPTQGGAKGGFARDYRMVLADPFARFVIVVAFLEFAFMFGGFAYVGADLHLRFGLSFTLVGLMVGFFGLGGLIYAGTVKQLVRRLGQSGLAFNGGLLLCAAYLLLAFAPAWWLAPVAVTVIGLGFYMLHNTLQTVATQMTPQARGTAVGLFSAALYLGQTAGVATFAVVVDRFGAPRVFLIVALLMPALAFWIGRRLKRR
ncbi:MAG TPA: MFS transporter [Xanthobacteraceae bacterium]|nr:MFS transporter [Xanthobacteraceae bacterium]